MKQYMIYAGREETGRAYTADTEEEAVENYKREYFDQQGEYPDEDQIYQLGKITAVELRKEGRASNE